MNIRAIMRQIALVVVVASFACGGDAGNGGDATPSIQSAPPAGGTVGAAPAAAGSSATLISDMRAHLTRIQSAGGDIIVPQIPEHTRLVNQLLTQLTQERPSRGPAWDALADSVRQDLTRMASMDAASLDEFVDVHAGRVTRLIDMP